MNIREMIVPLALAIATTWTIQYFFFGQKDQQYRFTAPQSQVECVPLSKEVQFQVPEKLGLPTITPIATDWATIAFSNHGATIDRLEFKRIVNGTTRLINTVFPPSQEGQYGAFLVALPTHTPVRYELKGMIENEKTVAVTYEALSSVARIRKTFIVHKELCQIDLNLEIESLTAEPINARILFPAPLMPQLKDQELVAADVMYGADKVEKIYQAKISPDSYWVKPTLFGVENKYYVHIMIADKDGFAQRCYYDVASKDRLTAIIEGPTVTAAESWTTSFYLGPKEVKYMQPVSSKLDGIVDTGFFKPIYWFMLWLLTWLYEYLHNYGLAIIAMTILSKLILLPFAWRAEQGNKSRAELQRSLQYIQQKYKNDPDARAKAQAEFLQKNGLGLAGCLPLFMQVPIFFGLSSVLSTSVQMYQTPFLWMNDLSAPDPYYILPFIVMVGMLLSTFGSMDARQRVPVVAMAIAFGAVSTSMSAGVVMYLALSTGLNVVQSKLFKFFRLV